MKRLCCSGLAWHMKQRCQLVLFCFGRVGEWGGWEVYILLHRKPCHGFVIAVMKPFHGRFGMLKLFHGNKQERADSLAGSQIFPVTTD